MEVVVAPGDVAGTVRVPPSKSATHRALVGAAIGGGGRIHRPLIADDTIATVELLREFGASVDVSPQQLAVTGWPGGPPTTPASPIDCANSGMTLRLGLGLAALTPGPVTLTGDASLRRRPNGPLLSALRELGADIQARNDTAPITVRGPVHGGTVRIDGSLSSQFVSSLLVLGGLAPEGISVAIDGPVVSRPYLTLTVTMLEHLGVEIHETAEGYRVDPHASLRAPPPGWVVGGDPTAAATWLAAGALAGSPAVTVSGLDPGFHRPVRFVDVLAAMDVTVHNHDGELTIERDDPQGSRIDLQATPDLLPTAGVVAAVADGTTRIDNCSHARAKETDRIRTTADMLRALSVDVTEREDGLEVVGRPAGVAGGTVDARGDHRLVMAASVAALAADGPVTIRDAEAAEVSYPAFFETLETLGATVRRPG